jgi:hypothetical protein
MTRIISRGAFIGLAVAPLVALAACGSSSGGGRRRLLTSARVGVHPATGSQRDSGCRQQQPRSILVDQQGRTLYLFARGFEHHEYLHGRLCRGVASLRSAAQPTVAEAGPTHR